MTNKKWNIAGLIFTCLATIFFFVVGVRAYKSFQYFHQLNSDALAYEPARFKVDLSQVGQYTSPCEQKYIHIHGEILGFDLEPAIVTDEELQIALEGLAGTIVIRDDQNEPVKDVTFNSSDIRFEKIKTDDRIPAVYLGFPFNKGQYTVILTIDTPANNLSNISQQAVMAYVFCGLEEIPESIMRIAYAASFIGGIIGVIVIGILTRNIVVLTKK